VIDGYFHVKLGSYKYRLATNSDDQHYSARLVPLNISNAQVVQSSDPKYDLRPDTAVWEMTDWSGGEGTKKFDNETGNEYDLSYNIDALHTPGSIRLANAVEAAGINRTGTLVKASDKLFHFSSSDDTIGTYSGNLANTTWDEQDAGTISDSDYFGVRGDGDGKHIYMPIGSLNDIYRYEPHATYTNDMADTTKWVDADSQVKFGRPLVKIGNKIFVVHLDGTKISVVEYSTTATPTVSPTEIFVAYEGNLDAGSNQGIVCRGDNELFVCVRTKAGESILYRITPASALGEAFGTEVGRFPGFSVDCIWYASGVLLLAGTSTTTGVDKRTIYYVKGTELGSFGLIRQDATFTDAKLITSTDASRMDRTFFLAPTGSASNYWTLFTIDLLTGAIFGGPEFSAVRDPNSVVDFLGRTFVSENKGSASTQTYRTASTYATSGELITAVHDFDIGEEKTLMSIRLSTEPLPANTAVQVYYQDDQDGTWTSAGTYDTDSGTGTTFKISTDSSSVKFKNLQLKIKLTTSDATTTPVVRSVQVRCTPTEYVREWDMLLDISDEDAQAQGRAFTGAQLIDYIKAEATNENIIQFNNGYETPSAGSYDEHDVMIREYNINLTSAGQGVANIKVREVE
tara:strand:+ start:6185 stop:8068 length:1884 start_codon:yes stop_codon:yes gene_type:complete